MMKRTRTPCCTNCRQAKSKCERLDTPSAPCKRCLTKCLECVVAAPTASDQRKRRRRASPPPLTVPTPYAPDTEDTAASAPTPPLTLSILSPISPLPLNFSFSPRDPPPAPTSGPAGVLPPPPAAASFSSLPRLRPAPPRLVVQTPETPSSSLGISTSIGGGVGVGVGYMSVPIDTPHSLAPLTPGSAFPRANPEFFAHFSFTPPPTPPANYSNANNNANSSGSGDSGQAAAPAGAAFGGPPVASMMHSALEQARFLNGWKRIVGSRVGVMDL